MFLLTRVLPLVFCLICAFLCMLNSTMIPLSGDGDVPVGSVSAVVGKKTKASRLEKAVALIESNPLPIQQTLASWSKPHELGGNAIFTSAIDASLRPRHAIYFAGTLRQTGFDGDIVMAIHPSVGKEFINKLKEFKVTAYFIDLKCDGGIQNSDFACSLPGLDIKASLNTLRFYLYQQWALKYSDASMLFLSDFWDVFFQSDPFKFHHQEWKGLYQLVVYQEAHPNMLISRSPHNKGAIENCYGGNATLIIGSNVLSSSGTVMGTRIGIAVYSYLITKQLDPRVRYWSQDTRKTNKGCLTGGMDQAFHNWILYTGVLNNYMDVKVYPQGEGAVNIVGGFTGQQKRVQFDIGEYGWNILKGESPYKYIHNWGGEISPVVHQLDRFNHAEITGGYKQHMSVFQNLGLLA